MTGALLALPAHLRRRLADALDAGVLAGPFTLASLQSVLGVQVGGEDVVAALTALMHMGMSGPACAASAPNPTSSTAGQYPISPL